MGIAGEREVRPREMVGVSIFTHVRVQGIEGNGVSPSDVFEALAKAGRSEFARNPTDLALNFLPLRSAAGGVVFTDKFTLGTKESLSVTMNPVIGGPWSW